MDMYKLLFVEDNDDYRVTLTKVLENAGYEVVAAANALQAIEKLSFETFDLVISDLMMEGIDGLEFLSLVKKINPEMRTIILTGDPSNNTELEALDLYIDKYLSKETSREVLLKHIETLLKKDKMNKVNNFIIEDKQENIVVDLDGITVKKDGELISVTPKEFQIIKFLLQNKGKAVSREEIIEKLWDEEEEEIDIRVIDVHVKAIRRKLNAQTIVSVRGFGYKWD